MLKRIIPVTPTPGFCDELPTGIKILLVELNAAIALVVCALDPKLTVLVLALTKNTLLDNPLTAKFVLALAPLTVIVPPAAASLILLPVSTMLPPCTLPPVILPVALIKPAVKILPPVMLAVAVT